MLGAREVGPANTKANGSKDRPIDFMRHYYDVYGLLQRPEVQAFIGTEAYKAHKAKRFPKADNQNISRAGLVRRRSNSRHQRKKAARRAAFSKFSQLCPKPQRIGFHGAGTSRYAVPSFSTWPSEGNG